MTFAVWYIGVRIAETLACVALSWESGSGERVRGVAWAVGIAQNLTIHF